MFSTLTETTSKDPQRVLIIDRSEDNREVLKTVLQRHGVQIVEAARGEEGLRLASQLQPDVVILDLDTVDAEDQLVCDSFNESLREVETTIVLLGRVPPQSTLRSSREAISKPYHYRPLIRKIEELLQHADEPRQPREELDT